jgi:hypothetical protein
MSVTGVGASPTLIMWCLFLASTYERRFHFPSGRRSEAMPAGVELGEPDSGCEPYRGSPVLVILAQPR